MKIDKEAKHKFDYAATAICDKYCKYPLIWDEDQMGPISESFICKDCPLIQFDKDVEVVGDES